ncbi:MAG: OmpW family outer membrane protein [Pseudoxanthomonas sp.]
MHRTLLKTTLVLALPALACPAFAQSRGEWAVALGAHQVNPRSDSGTLAGGTLPVRVDSSVRPTVSLEYFVADNLGVEVLAALPFQHGIQIRGLGTVGSTRQLPPTVSLQYHFNHQGQVSPFLGAGVNYTTFFSEDTRGALAGSTLALGDSWGLAAHAGLDFKLGTRGALRVDVRWMDIDSAVRLDGTRLGTAHLDPWIYGAAYVQMF